MIALTEGMTPAEFLTALNDNYTEYWGVANFSEITDEDGYIDAINNYFEESVVSFGQSGASFKNIINNKFINSSALVKSYGKELVRNGTFDDESAWTVTVLGFTIHDGKAWFAGDYPNDGYLIQKLYTEIGKIYKLEFTDHDDVNLPDPAFENLLNWSDYVDYPNGTYSLEVTCLVTQNNFTLYGATCKHIGEEVMTFDIDNISLKEVVHIRPRIGYCPQALAYFARMETPPPTGLKDLLNEKIVEMLNGGIYYELDKFVFQNLHTEQASLLDIKGYKDNVAVGSSLWTEKIGVTTDTDKYVDTQYNAATDGVKYTAASAAIIISFDHVDIDGHAQSGVNSTIANHFSTYNGGASAYNRFDSVDGAGNFSLESPDGLIIVSRVASTTKVNTLEQFYEIERNCAYVGLFALDYCLGKAMANDQCPGFTYRQIGFGSGMNKYKRDLLARIIQDFNERIATAY